MQDPQHQSASRRGLGRRDWMRLGAGVATATSLPSLSRPARAQGSTLTIAYPAAPAGWDPNSGPQATSPGNQTLFRSVYEPYFSQRPDLSLAPGVIERFGWTEDRGGISLTLRAGVTWQDGKPVTPEDIAWNLRRLADPATGGPMQSVFASNKDIRVEGATIHFKVEPWRANMLERLSFISCYLIPPHYYESVGAAGFERAPMGCGPYRFDHYERGSFLRLKAFPGHWAGAPAFDTVIYKFLPDNAARIAEVERGGADVAVDVSYEEYDRLRQRQGLAGNCSPIADVALMFINNDGPFKDPNVRRAAAMAVDKQAIVQRLHRGYAKALDTLLAPEYKGYDAGITAPHDPARAAALLAQSGFSPANPVQLTVQTTRGYKPKDYETVQAIVQMWRRVGINASIEVYEIAKHFELRTQHRLAPAAFYDWGNATADPESSLGTALLSSSPHSSWKGGELDAGLTALFSEHDEAKRLAGYQALNRRVAEEAFILPLYQLYQPIIHRADLEFTAHRAGFVMPTQFRRAG